KVKESFNEFLFFTKSQTSFESKLLKVYLAEKFLSKKDDEEREKIETIKEDLKEYDWQSSTSYLYWPPSFFSIITTIIPPSPESNS
ncbi:MAG: hypothetical protein D6780_05070, partial [Candidatus Dadabacteria bacterium]